METIGERASPVHVEQVDEFHEMNLFSVLLDCMVAYFSLTISGVTELRPIYDCQCQVDPLAC